MLRATGEIPASNDRTRPTGVFDLSLLSEVGDEDYVRDILQTFIDSLPIQLAELETAMSAADPDRIYLIAHRLRGSTGMLQATAVSDRLGRLERLAKQKADCRSLVEELMPRFEQLRSELRDYLSPKNLNHETYLLLMTSRCCSAQSKGGSGKKGIPSGPRRTASKSWNRSPTRHLTSPLLMGWVMPYARAGLGDQEAAVRLLPGKKVPVIILSSMGQEDVVLEAFQLGADDNITNHSVPTSFPARGRTTVDRLNPLNAPAMQAFLLRSMLVVLLLLAGLIAFILLYLLRRAALERRNSRWRIHFSSLIQRAIDWEGAEGERLPVPFRAARSLKRPAARQLLIAELITGKRALAGSAGANLVRSLRRSWASGPTASVNWPAPPGIGRRKASRSLPSWSSESR